MFGNLLGSRSKKAKSSMGTDALIECLVDVDMPTGFADEEKGGCSKDSSKRSEKETKSKKERFANDSDDEEIMEGDDETMESGLLLAVVKRGAEICLADESDNVPRGASRKAGVSVRVTFMYYGLAGDGQISAERTRRFTQQSNFRRRELGLPHGSLVSGLGSWGGPENAPIKLFGFRLMDAVEPQRALEVLEGVSAVPLPACIVTACHSLQGVVPSVMGSSQRAEKAAKGLAKTGCKASLAHIAAFYLYTMETAFYKMLNAAMRDTDRNKARPYFAYLRLLFSALESFQAPQASYKSLYRGVGLDLSADHPVGSEVVWWGASSCTPKLAVAKGFLGSSGNRTLFEVRQRSAVPIKQYSAFRGEEEWLLGPGHRFKVESLVKKGGGLTEVTVVELEPPRAIR